MAEEIRLRGHHLICLHFFRGEGYDAGFIANLSEIIKRVESGQLIRICDGTDDVCVKCPYFKADKCIYDADSEAEIKRMDAFALQLLHSEFGMRLNWQGIRDKLPRVFKTWNDNYCIDCSWRDACLKNPLWHKLLK